ncbi:MAG: reductive dehalogenase [Candidatus Heimdallarchaeota archaeon]|nr:MAG: reductive dehalogenase [Candidatus Heimdallarchaeota archaeon]
MTESMDRKQLKQNFMKVKIPFALDGSKYKRFSEVNTIYSRVTQDNSFSMFKRAIPERQLQKVGKKGYSHKSYAAVNAAWTVYDHFYDAYSWNKIQGIPVSRIMEYESQLPKCEFTDTKKNNEIVKRLGQIFGACATGITKVDPEQLFIYSHNSENKPLNLPEGVKYAIVMLMEMDYEGIGTSPSVPAAIATGEAYSRMTFAIACMAQFLRNLGYQAVPSGNDTGLSIPLAIQAGLGQFGRHGLLITPKFGPRVRICKVFTDFPLELDKPIDFGVTQFCRICKKCAKYCPSQSISHTDGPTWDSPWKTPSNNPGVYKWYVNVDSCYKFWVQNSSDCSNCIRVCPFNKPTGFFHNMARFFIKHFHFLDKLWIQLDNFMALFPWWSYGKKRDPDKFWSLHD